MGMRLLLLFALLIPAAGGCARLPFVRRTPARHPHEQYKRVTVFLPHEVGVMPGIPVVYNGRTIGQVETVMPQVDGSNHVGLRLEPDAVLPDSRRLHSIHDERIGRILLVTRFQ